MFPKMGTSFALPVVASVDAGAVLSEIGFLRAAITVENQETCIGRL